MKLHFKFSIMLLLWNITTAYGQGKPLKYLSVGDTLPGINLKLINADKPKINTADLKGKFVILDFWATWCVPCVAQFSHLSQLQDKFRDELIILPVAIDGTAQSNLEFYNQRKKQGDGIKLPSVVEDSLLRKMFYFTTVPHEVWLDETGVVLAITDHVALTDSTIQRMIDKKPLTFALKYTDPTFDKYKPFLVAGNGGSDSSFFARSILTKYKPQIRGASLVDSSRFRNRIFLANRTVPFMYQRLYAAKYERLKDKSYLSRELYNNDKRIIIETNSEKFLQMATVSSGTDVYEASKRKLLFCYELILPANYTMVSSLNKAIRDMDSFWNVHSSIETRMIKGLALIRTSGNDKLKTKGGEHFQKYAQLENDSLKMRNEPIGNLASMLSLHGDRLPIVFDETGYREHVDIKIAFAKKRATTSDLNKELARYDLALRTKEYLLEMLVIKD